MQQMPVPPAFLAFFVGGHGLPALLDCRFNRTLKRVEQSPSNVSGKMQSVEIERLLQWAFCIELPKRTRFGPRGPGSAWRIAESYAQLGCRVDVSPSSRSAIPHRDALIIADEVAGLRGSLAIDFHQWKASCSVISSRSRWKSLIRRLA